MTVFRIEIGSSSPTVAVLEKLALALRIHVGDFFHPRSSAPGPGDVAGDQAQRGRFRRRRRRVEP